MTCSAMRLCWPSGFLRRGPPTRARRAGLLLLQARNKALLERIIQVVNDKQKTSGELGQLTERQHGGTTYHMREFPPEPPRPPEWYVAYPDGTFAFSNSEALIQSVIDRKQRELSQSTLDASHARPDAGVGTDRGLTDLARFQSVRHRQSDKALARLFVEPRQIERLIAGKPRPSKASDARIMAMIEHYLSAVEYAGATLEWNDAGVVLHTVETLDRSKLEPWLLRWAGNDLPPDATLSRVPATAIALASGHVDAAALYEALCLIVPDLDQAKLRNLETMLGGVLLGQDLRTRILPQLGPGLVAYVEPAPDVPDAERGAVVPTPPASRPFAQVLALSLRNSGGGVTTAAAIENALRAPFLPSRRSMGNGTRAGRRSRSRPSRALT